jgi:hypothetical protein
VTTHCARLEYAVGSPRGVGSKGQEKGGAEAPPEEVVRWIRRHWRVIAAVLGGAFCFYAVMIYFFWRDYVELFGFGYKMLTK